MSGIPCHIEPLLCRVLQPTVYRDQTSASFIKLTIIKFHTSKVHRKHSPPPPPSPHLKTPPAPKLDVTPFNVPHPPGFLLT